MTSMEQQWEQVCDHLRDAADHIMYQPFPKLLAVVSKDVEEFVALPPPGNSQELLARQLKVDDLVNDWNAKMAQRSFTTKD